MSQKPRSNPVDRFLIGIQRGFDRLLLRIERGADYAVDALVRYSKIVSRFLYHVFVALLKGTWVLIELSVFLLAPAYLASFGHEITLTGTTLFYQIVGWGMATVGLTTIALILVGSIVIFGPTEQKDRIPEDHGGYWLLIVIDIISVVIILVLTRAHHRFESPLLQLTQQWAGWIYHLFRSLI